MKIDIEDGLAEGAGMRVGAGLGVVAQPVEGEVIGDGSGVALPDLEADPALDPAAGPVLFHIRPRPRGWVK